MIVRWENTVIELDREAIPPGDGWQNYLGGLSAGPVDMEFSPVRVDDPIWDDAD